MAELKRGYNHTKLETPPLTSLFIFIPALTAQPRLKSYEAWKTSAWFSLFIFIPALISHQLRSDTTAMTDWSLKINCFYVCDLLSSWQGQRKGQTASQHNYILGKSYPINLIRLCWFRRMMYLYRSQSVSTHFTFARVNLPRNTRLRSVSIVRICFEL